MSRVEKLRIVAISFKTFMGKGLQNLVRYYSSSLQVVFTLFLFQDYVVQTVVNVLTVTLTIYCQGS